MTTYEVGVFRGREVIRARLREGLDADAPEVREALSAWDGAHHLHRDADGLQLVLVRPPETEDGPRWWLHALLFLLTLVTTHMAGALMVGVDPFRSRAVEVLGVMLPVPTAVDPAALLDGASFALPLMAILFFHEMGHYLTARRHGVPVTPPFFIPFPAYWSVIGTLGAFIRIKGPMVRRSVLFDVGAGGPLASFLLSVPVLWVGLGLSTPVPGEADLFTPFLLPFAGQALSVGSGPVVHLMAALRFPDALGAAPIVLHPLAFAGWLGLFVTALNLLPLGQLDGGHVLYALSGPLQHRMGKLFLASLLPLGFLWWGWWLWAVVAFAVNRGRVAHPPVLQDQVELGRGRRLLARLCVVIFFATFVPVPVAL